MKKILVVDDDPVNRMVLEELLEDQPYLVKMAESGHEALAIARQFKPDVVLLDIMMPGIDGYTTCQQLRGDEGCQDTKIMFVSAKALMSNKLEGFASGGDDYVSKPFIHSELLAKAQLLLQLKSVEETDWCKQELVDWVNGEVRAGVLGHGDSPEEGDAPGAVASEDVIARCGRHVGLLERLEEIDELKSSGAKLTMASVNLAKLARSTIEKYATQARQKNIEIRLEAPTLVKVEGDAEKLSCVLRSLLDNALRFNTDGTPIVLEIVKEGEFVTLSVTDHGQRVDPEKVFDEFCRENWQCDEEGVGLSLALGRAIMEQHGGAIDVESDSASEQRVTIRLKSA